MEGIATDFYSKTNVNNSKELTSFFMDVVMHCSNPSGLCSAKIFNFIDISKVFKLFRHKIGNYNCFNTISKVLH